MNRIMSINKWIENCARYGESKGIHVTGISDTEPDFIWYEIIRGQIFKHYGSYNTDGVNAPIIQKQDMPNEMYEYYNPVAVYAGGYAPMRYTDMIAALTDSPDIEGAIVSSNAGYVEFEHWSGVSICMYTISSLCRTNNTRTHSGLHCLYFSRELTDPETKMCYIAFKYDHPEDKNIKKKISAAKNTIMNVTHNQFAEVEYVRKVYM